MNPETLHYIMLTMLTILTRYHYANGFLSTGIKPYV